MPEEFELQAESRQLERTFSVERSGINEDERTIELAFSSEEPVARREGLEILDHSPESVDLGRLRSGGAVLVEHDANDHVGVVERVSIDNDRRGRVRVRFGKGVRASEIWQDVVDGIRKHVSVGYQVQKAVVETRTDDGYVESYRVTQWSPFEVSLVAIPADFTVGINRSLDPKTPEIKTETPQQEIRIMSDENVVTPAAPAIDVDAIRNDTRSTELARIKNIEAEGVRFDLQGAARSFINDGKSVGDFREYVLNTVEERTSAAPTVPVTHLGLSQTETNQFSLMRAINAAATGDWSKAGFERDCSNEISDRLDKEARGFYVPFDVMNRTQNMTTAADGGNLVANNLMAGSFIESLRAQSLIGSLGATFLDGLVGTVDIPRQIGSAAFYWLGEDADVTDSDAQFDKVSLSPTTVAGSVYMTRRLRKQSTPSIENLILSDLIKGASLAIDAAAFNGSGAANQPLGIIGQSGVSTQTILAPGTPTFAEMVGFKTKVASDNALLGSLSYVTTPVVAGALETTPKDAGSGIMLLNEGRSAGYAVNQSNNIPANTILFGNFNDVMVGSWGVLDVNPDTATKAAADGLFLRVFQDLDVAIRHPESFCKNA